jgi:hypothetical protein
MRLCDDVITVYNSYTDPLTRYKVYLPTVLRGVSWFGSLQVTVGNDGLLSASQYSIRIPSDADSEGKQYVSPKEFAAIPNDQMPNYWTLSEGDSIVHGAVNDTGTDAKPGALEAKYDEVINIVAVTDNRRVTNAPHWKVVGK